MMAAARETPAAPEHRARAPFILLILWLAWVLALIVMSVPEWRHPRPLPNRAPQSPEGKR